MMKTLLTISCDPKQPLILRVMGTLAAVDAQSLRAILAQVIG